MDYYKIYEQLITRAIDREIIEGYKESHHIVPKCMGGPDTQDNLVDLTAEEHYVAHQLLVKMYPEESSLIYACHMMRCANSEIKRNNKIYGWVRRRYSTVCKKRIGKKNGSYGRSWYHSPETLESGKFLKEEVPDGWIKGRTPKRRCIVCSAPTSTKYGKLCSEHLEKSIDVRLASAKEERKRNHPLVQREDEFLKAYEEFGSINKAVQHLGFDKAEGSLYYRAKELLEQNNRL